MKKLKAVKAKNELDKARDKHRIYAQHRIRLLEEVKEYQKDRKELDSNLNKAIEQILRQQRKTTPDSKASATSPGTAELSVDKLQELIEKLYRQEMQLYMRSAELMESVLQPIDGATKSKAKTLLARAAKRMAPLIEDRLLWDREKQLKRMLEYASKAGLKEDEALEATYQGLSPKESDPPVAKKIAGYRRVLKRASKSGLIENKVHASLDRSLSLSYKKRSKPNTEVAKIIMEHRKVRRRLDPALDELRRLTHWMDPTGAGDLETALICHPALADFEEKWGVLVNFDINDKGRVTIYPDSIVDDFFPLGIRWVSMDEIRQVIRRLYRQSDRYLLINRRVAYDQIRKSLAPLMDPESSFKKDPFVWKSVKKKHSPFNKKYGFTKEDDLIIVRHCANQKKPNYQEITAHIYPKEAEERGRHKTGSPKRIPRPTGKHGTYFNTLEKHFLWDSLVDSVRNRWKKVLKPIVKPKPIRKH